MLSVPTLWVVFIINFLSLGLVWSYVMRSYPSFGAARFWAAAAFVAAAGAAISLLRGYAPPLFPVLIGGGLLVFAGCLACMGIQRLYRRPVMWRTTALVTFLTVFGLGLFAVWQDNMSARIFIYSIAQSAVMVMILPLLFSRREGLQSPGARMTGYITVLCIAIYWVRPVASVLQVGGDVSLIEFNAFQAWLIVLLVFATMAWNFGFLLLAIDRLRAEVAELALSDDLTGAANRRQLQIRLDEECARSGRTQEPFALLLIDIDGFKAINDSQGHGAGDDCLRLLTRAVQARLRSGDLLARMGGDEFCVVLPSTTLREGAMMARRVLEACRAQWTPRDSAPISFTASIGVAQWRNDIGQHPDRLIAEADQALYAAKHSGKDRYALHEPVEAAPEPHRKSA